MFLIKILLETSKSSISLLTLNCSSTNFICHKLLKICKEAAGRRLLTLGLYHVHNTKMITCYENDKLHSSLWQAEVVQQVANL